LQESAYPRSCCQRILAATAEATRPPTESAGRSAVEAAAATAASCTLHTQHAARHLQLHGLAITLHFDRDGLTR
jgi:hypothetical protein